MQEQLTSHLKRDRERARQRERGNSHAFYACGSSGPQRLSGGGSVSICTSICTHCCVCVPSQEKAAFRELVAQLELDPKCRGLPFSSFLILPFQRITRLKLLVQVLPPRQHPLGSAGVPYTTQFPSVTPELHWLSGSPFVSQVLIKLLLCAKHLPKWWGLSRRDHTNQEEVVTMRTISGVMELR